MAEKNQTALIAHFASVTGVEGERAKFYLESAGWNLDLALGSFYDDDGADEPHHEAPGGTTSQDVPSVSEPSPASATKKAVKPSRFATIGSMKGADESDSSEEEHQAYYAGGSEHGAGQQVLGPKKKKESASKIVENMFKAAKEHGAEEVGAGSSSSVMPGGDPYSRFGGLGYRLGDTEGPSQAVGSGKTQHQPTQVDMVLKLWSNGFSVDDGPLRDFQDSANQEFLECIKRGEVPQELIREAKGGEVNLNMEDHRHEDYVKPKQTVKAFSGEGNKLGSPAPHVVSTPSIAEQKSGEQNAQASLTLDSSQSVTNIQIRLMDGSRMVAKFNHSHTVADIRSYILSARPQFAETNFVLMTTFPNKELTDETKTLQEANLLNSVLVQRGK